ncbi:MAG: PAS domain-containing protein [Halothiobacillaceae bacterium]|nr:PAS domain-containing protein [Halothiobacillaceae bacterium]
MRQMSAAAAARQRRPVTGREVPIEGMRAILSRTDPSGVITYVSRSLVEISGYTEEEMLGQPHNILRHPDMPCAVFHLMWMTLKAGKEFYGMTKNRAKNGDHYWVFARVAPIVRDGTLVGYTSARFIPKREMIEEWDALYTRMLEAENASNVADSERCKHGAEVLVRFLRSKKADNLTEYVMRQL